MLAAQRFARSLAYKAGVLTKVFLAFCVISLGSQAIRGAAMEVSKMRGVGERPALGDHIPVR